MNVFIVFVKFLDLIVAICVRLVRLIEEKEGLKVLEGGPTIKIKYIITIYIYIYIKGPKGPPWAPTWVRPCLKLKFVEL